MKILIIEDEYNLADAISVMLQKEKYQTEIMTNGEDGLDEALTNLYDLIILDVMLPGMDGFSILKELKKEDIDAKVLMLTAKSTIEDKMEGFDAGADDYLTKPFHMDELLARVNARLRKSNSNVGILEYGDLSLDIKKANLLNNDNGQSIDLIGKELSLLELFMNNPEKILEKEHIFTKIWGYESDAELNTLEAYISFLRKKIKKINSKVTIKASRNLGYKMVMM